MLKYPKKTYRNFLNNLCKDYNNCSVCMIKEYLTREQPSVRMLLQTKCIEILRLQLTKKAEKELSWDDVMIVWIKNEYAIKFRQEYQKLENIVGIDKIDIKKLYNTIVKEKLWI